MKKNAAAFCSCFVFLCLMCASFSGGQDPTAEMTKVVLFPSDKAEKVNPDTHLKIIFQSTPALGKSGRIRIYDAADNRLVDLLDLTGC